MKRNELVFRPFMLLAMPSMSVRPRSVVTASAASLITL